MTDSEKLDLLINQVGGIRSDVSGLKEDVSRLKEDVSGLKEDVSGLKEDVSGLKEDVSRLKEDVSGLKEGQQRIWLHLENNTDKYLRILAENHIDLVRKLNENNMITEADKLYQLKVDYLEKDVRDLKKDMSVVKAAMAG